MKTVILRRTACLLAAVLLLTFLTGCANSPAVFSYGGKTVTEQEFTYYLATYKERFAETYSDFKDTPAFYSMQLGDTGKTAEESLFEVAVRNVKMTLVCDALYDEYGFSLDPSVAASIDAYLDDFITEYAGGSKTQFNQALSQYGINLKMLREIYLRDERAADLYNRLYLAENAVNGVSDSDRDRYLEENYVRVRHIYVNNKYVYETDADGYAVYSEDGLKQTIPMNGELLEAANAKIEAADQALADGTDFEEVYRQYSEDQYYKNGYYLTRGTDFVSDVVSSAFDLEIGEWVKLESDVGTHYIMRLELQEAPWTEEDNADFFTDYDTDVASELFTRMIEAELENVETDGELLAGFSLADSPINYRF